MQSAIKNDTEISDATKRTYLGHLSTLNHLVEGSTIRLFRSPEKVFALLQETYPSHATRKQLLASLRAVVTRVPAITAKFPTVCKTYGEIMAKDEEESGTQQRIMNGELSDREKRSWLPWKDVLAVQKRIAAEHPGEPEALLLSVYTLMEPLRQDFGNIRIVYSEAEARALSDTQGYVQLDRANHSAGILVLRQYKTAKRYGAFRRALPPDLVREIWISLEKKPRDHLFGPYTNRNSFVQFSNRALCKLFAGRRVTVNTLRHSFISGIDFNTRTPGELFRASKMMAHGIGMQQMYRRLPKEGDVVPPKPPRKKRGESAAPPPTPPPAPAAEAVKTRPKKQPAPTPTPTPAPTPPPPQPRAMQRPTFVIVMPSSSSSAAVLEPAAASETLSDRLITLSI